jgi:hypothetical protein
MLSAIISWFNAQSDEVKVGALLFFGAALTVVVGAFTGTINAIGTIVNGAWSRGHERKKASRERLLDKRGANAEIIIDKLNSFHKRAFETQALVERLNSELLSSLQQKPSVDATHIFVSAHGDSRPSLSPLPQIMNSTNNSLAKLKERVEFEDNETSDWFKYEAFRYWAWFHNPKDITTSIRKIARWYGRFYFEIDNEINALRVLYKSAPLTATDNFEELRDAFTKKVEKQALQLFTHEQHDDDLVAAMTVLQKVLIRYLD